MFSTTEDGRIVRGLSGVPNDGPVLLVGNHMLLGIDMLPLITEFLREKRTVLRGMAHPVLFNDRRECSFEGHHLYDYARLCGAVPVTDRNLYRLLSEKSFVLLYPGGSREALHRKVCLTSHANFFLFFCNISHLSISSTSFPISFLVIEFSYIYVAYPKYLGQMA